ncbi:Short-chain dehydrogenase [Penicillium macrosclerotiorum]|uniref:Short-chain dehydrogenase n=1 Tax=Penicillium macrosclerotiorum TaxID=303699 RepID=UPI002549B8B0|nr:Short-chain dehydrogenase [Penicillium macrosclerotiorum]KAJ5682837.1 Short-chain dehydrogenase [Penicillium macrosclerotiorum]
MSPRLSNKVSIVTGSSSGLGRAISLRYAREGAKVVCADLRPSARLEGIEENDINTHDLIKQNGGDAIFIRTDVGVAHEMEALVKAAITEYGRLDIMVNNAGVCLEALNPRAKCHETSEDLWDTTMRINVKSVFLGCKYATAQMLAQEPHQSGDRGWIINISSIMALIGGQYNPSYCASKGAVSSLTRQVALDYASSRIHVNAICPGYTQTAIFKETTERGTSLTDLERKHPFNGPGMPSDIANAAVVLASEDASWITGISLPVDGGYTAR